MSFYRKRWYDYVGDALAIACWFEAWGLLVLLLVALGFLLHWIFS